MLKKEERTNALSWPKNKRVERRRETKATATKKKYQVTDMRSILRRAIHNISLFFLVAYSSAATTISLKQLSGRNLNRTCFGESISVSNSNDEMFF